MDTSPDPTPRVKPRFRDLTGEHFDRLTVEGFAGIEGKGYFWWCRCSCEAHTLRKVEGAALKGGKTRSCGCLCREMTIASNKARRGERRPFIGPRIPYRVSPEYDAWSRMKSKCYNTTHADYSYYGARGIKVAERWLGTRRAEGFHNFLADMGPRPSPQHSLDRIDNNGDYTPENCRWATMKTQCRNRRSCQLITIGGETLTIVEWAERAGLEYGTLHQRLFKFRWSPERALSTPPGGVVRRPRGGAPKKRGAPKPWKKTHGGTGTSEYYTWDSMKSRCNNPRHHAYARYGGRGITVCDRWEGPDGFANFRADMGLRPSLSHSLDRIDNDGPYSPDNCRWATAKEQAANRG